MDFSVTTFFSTNKCASYSLLIQAVSAHTLTLAYTAGAMEAVPNNNAINLATCTEREFLHWNITQQILK
jgi:hypothetical protein